MYQQSGHRYVSDQILARTGSNYGNDEDYQSTPPASTRLPYHQDHELISPYTWLKYRIDGLGPQVSEVVRSLLQDGSQPRFTLSSCRLRDGVYDFEMTELVRRAVRIGPNDLVPKCRSCSPFSPMAEAAGNLPVPCNHGVWLMDQIAKHAIYNIDPVSPLPMGPGGFAAALGSPFDTIAMFHLDLLAARLNCTVSPPTPPGEVLAAVVPQQAIDSWRVAEIRKMLSTVSKRRLSADWGSYRPDIFDQIGPNLLGNLIKPGDLEYTIFRMLYDNEQFFHYFHSQMSRRCLVHDRYKRLETQVFHVLQLHDDYLMNQTSPTPPEGSCDAIWAQSHIESSVAEITTAVERTNPRLGAPERRSAVDALVYILGKVIDHNHENGFGARGGSLYNLLIARDEDHDFLLGGLIELSNEAVYYVNQLEAYFNAVVLQGAPMPYLDRFHSLVTRVRNLKQ